MAQRSTTHRCLPGEYPVRSPGRLTWGSVKASPQTQLRLLELADLDAELARLDRRRRSLPEVAELARLEARASELKDALVVTETELASLQSEIENLHRRQGDLEEVVLELMERRETLDSRKDELTNEQEGLGGEMAAVAARRDAAFKENDEQAAKASDQRGNIAAEVPGELLALYDQIRKTKGVGAAMLRA